MKKIYALVAPVYAQSDIGCYSPITIDIPGSIVDTEGRGYLLPISEKAMKEANEFLSNSGYYFCPGWGIYNYLDLKEKADQNKTIKKMIKKTS